MSEPNNNPMNILFIISQYRELKVIDVDGGHKSKKFTSEIKSRSEIKCCGENADVMPEQTTLVSILKTLAHFLRVCLCLESPNNDEIFVD